MRFIACIALAATLLAPALRADVVVTKTKHQDAMKSVGGEQPATDTTEVTWFGKDRLRTEEGTNVTIVRGDLKKMYLLDTKAKTVTTLDLPVDMKKYLPPEAAPMMEQMLGQMKVTVTPTTETKKIKDWNATKYTMTMSMGMMGGNVTQDLWMTKDVEIDHKAFNELSSAMFSTVLGGKAIADEYKKLEGFPVLVEATRKTMGPTLKSREEVTAIETKEPTEGLYEVPKDYTEKPFDPMADAMGPGGGGQGGRPKPPPPSEKPKEKG
jgi:hypothetical protein